MTEYAKRDARALEPYYNRHVSAMTREKLNAKSDIAAELAWRDKLIAELTARTAFLEANAPVGSWTWLRRNRRRK